jgi:serine protease Do
VVLHPVKRSPKTGDNMQSQPGALSARRWLIYPIWMVLAVATWGSDPAAAGSPTLNPANPRVTPAVEAARKVRGAVVNIHSERTVTNPADPFAGTAPSVNRVNGMGTGIVIDPRGYIVTNNHVVEDVQVIRIRLIDGSTYAGRILARDPENDLAVLKIDPEKPLPTITLGTAIDLMVLEPVIAIGNAFGYEHTHTMGTVSNVKRDVALNREVSYKGLIQTDASINPGNSGGPLLNMHGELIGVNVAIRAGAQNIAFAIPVDTMITVTADLISLRRRTGIGHGLTVRDVIDTSRNPIVRTCVVERVQNGSPAEKAGVQAGDQLVQIGGVEIRCRLDVERGFLERKEGDVVPVVVRRNNDEKSLELALPQIRREAGTAVALNPAMETIWRRLGIRVSPVDASFVQPANPQLRGGVVIDTIDSDGVAARAGIERGDILIGLHQFETLNADNVHWILTHPDLPSFMPLKFFIVRNGKVRSGLLPQLGN